MAQSYALPKDSQAAPVSRTGIAKLFVVLAIGAASLYMGFSQISPPSAVSESAPASEFSAGRARKHIEAIAQKPHPVGSAEHQRVRDYILGELSAIGLDTQTQKAQVVVERGGEAIGASVENTLATVPGTSNISKSILLVAHYDSVPTSFGASDDGSGVATLLETARALKAASPLKNDIVLLFTDAEEVGLLGARAFVEDKEAMKGIGVVFNFEARGNSGASIMFETSDGNSRLINEFAKASPSPVASSLIKRDIQAAAE